MKNSFKKIWSKRFSIRLAEVWLNAPLQSKKIWGVLFPDQKIVIENSFGTGFMEEKVYKQCLSYFVKKIERLSFEKFIEKRMLKEFKSFSNFCKNISKTRLQDYTNKKLRSLWQELCKREDRWNNFMWVIFLLDDILTQEISRLISPLSCVTFTSIRVTFVTF